MQRFHLDGHKAVVTGGGRGIGLAAAEALCEAGAKVVIADRDAEVARSGSEYLSSKGYHVTSIILDVTDSAAVDGAATELNSAGDLVDILVCNAGIARSGTPADPGDLSWAYRDHGAGVSRLFCRIPCAPWWASRRSEFRFWVRSCRTAA